MSQTTKTVTTEREVHVETARGSRSDRDLNKRDRKDGGGLGDSIRRSANATADSISGVSEAFAAGLREYNDHLTSDNTLRLGLDNGFIEGTIAGYARFFDEMAGTARRVLDDLRKTSRREERDSNSGPAVAVIDYDRLARLVAAEMLKQQQQPHIIATPDAAPPKK